MGSNSLGPRKSCDRLIPASFSINEESDRLKEDEPLTQAR